MDNGCDVEKFELASADWFVFAQQRLDTLHARYSQLVGDEKFSMCEVYRNVPAHIAEGKDEIAWSFAFHNGRVGVEFRERTDVDVWISWKYAAIMPIAKAIYSDDAKAMADVARLRQTAEQNGDRLSRGDLSRVPPGIARLLTELHNDLAVHTL